MKGEEEIEFEAFLGQDEIWHLTLSFKGPNLKKEWDQFVSSWSERKSAIRISQGTVQWTFYFRLKEEGSELCLVAHPEENKWVATLALKSTHQSLLINPMSESICLTDHLNLSQKSNLILTLDFPKT